MPRTEKAITPPSAIKLFPQTARVCQEHIRTLKFEEQWLRSENHDGETCIELEVR